MEKINIELEEFYRNEHGVLLMNRKFRVFTVVKPDGSPIEKKEEAKAFNDKLEEEVNIRNENFEKVMSATLFISDSTTAFVREWDHDFDFAMAAVERLLHNIME